MAVLTQGGLTGELERAEEEAVRFLNAILGLKHRLKIDQRVRDYGHITGCAESGAVRRASLDLTRALAKVRS